MEITIDYIVNQVGFNKIIEDLNIPKRTLQNWLYHMNEPAPYVVKLLAYYYDIRR